MPKADEALKWLQDSEDVPEWVTQALEGTEMRKENTRLSNEITELKPKAEAYDSQLAATEAKKAFEAAGVDWDAMKPLERQAAAKFADVGDPEKLEAYVAENELPTKQSPEGDSGDQQPTGAELISDQARRAARDSSTASKAVVNTEIAAKWPAEKWARFQEEHPELAERVLAGEEVPIAFS